MADPPWDIHMDLPYGTMMDSEMLKLPFKEMMDDGYFFLWVTGRAMELGRKCLQEWGYGNLSSFLTISRACQLHTRRVTYSASCRRLLAAGWYPTL